MKEIVFMGGKEIGSACLQHVLDRSRDLDIVVKAVLTNDRQLLGGGTSVSALAEAHGIPVLPSLEAFLEIPDVDILLSVQYHEILRQPHIDKARQIAVNLHMAPLPEYRGCNQFTFAILDGATEFGTTLHRLETSVDGGAILFEKRFPIPAGCYVTDLYAHTFAASSALFRESLEALVNGSYTPVPQADFLGSRSTSFHYRREINDVKVIDLNWPKERIARHIRATYFPPFDPPYALQDGTKVPLTKEWLENQA
ncbi:MAG: formyltransferase family protein [Bacteroidota bacterium]